PMMNMRFVIADHIIDLNKIPELAYIREADGRIEVGAMTRQVDLERSETIAKHCPLMAEALAFVGHRQTRNRGTIGGSLCHLDPAAELPTVAAALDATIHIQKKNGQRTLPMAEFPAFYMTPATEPDEIVTAIEFECWPEGHGFAFTEFARRHGDFAIVGVAVLLDVSPNGTVRRASVTAGGVGQAPVRCTEAEDLLTGRDIDGEIITQAAETCRAIDAMADVHASADYRRQLAVTLCRRAIGTALERASGPAAG
ncbi:MAG: FAD binding domain-containing protein, partial [Gammaproteobacteria bacterium]|nr:FAD binding domain-containing protein [Gammaproteobacteria bacterium]